MINLEKKHKIILAIIAFLVIVGVAAYLNYQDTHIETKTSSNCYDDVGTVICVKADLMGRDGVIQDEPIDVEVIGNNEVVDEFTIVSGEEHNVTGLKPNYYQIHYNYHGHYPYRSSLDWHDCVQIVSKEKYNELMASKGHVLTSEEIKQRDEVISWGQNYFGL